MIILIVMMMMIWIFVIARVNNGFPCSGGYFKSTARNFT